MKKQLLALIIAAGVSGCAGHSNYGSYESDDHYATRMDLIGAYMQQQQYQQSPTDVFIQSQRAFRRPRINVYQNFRRW